MTATILKFQPRFSKVARLDKQYKTTKGYIAKIIDYKPTGEFYIEAEISSQITGYDGKAYFNSQGKVWGKQEFYGDLMGVINDK
jgi:hypothetical protein